MVISFFSGLEREELKLEEELEGYLEDEDEE